MRDFKSILASQIKHFIRYRKACCHWNDSYESNLKRFDQYCLEHYSDHMALGQDMVDGWCIQRSSETNNSCRARIAPVVAFIRYLRERGLTSVNEPLIPKITKCTYIPHAFSNMELSAFFSACDNIPPVTHPNLLVLSRRFTVPVFFRLLYSNGLRICEARNLKKADVDLGQGIISIRRSKGNSQHFVVLHDSMLELMKCYDSAIAKFYPDRESFFPGRNGSCHSASWVDDNFKKIWDSISMENAIPYDLRHNYAVRNINRWSGPCFEFEEKLLNLGKSMGHRTIESTKYYYSITPVMSQVIVDKSGAASDWMLPEVADEKNK